MKTRFFLFISILLFSCSEENDLIEEVQNPLYEKLKGDYRASSILLDKAIDVNGDNIKTDDLLTEFGEARFSSKNHLVIKTRQTSTSTKEVLILTFPTLDPQSSLVGEFLSSAFVLGGEYSINGDYIISEDKTILSIRILSTSELEVKGKMNYYTREGWEEIKYIASYEKI